MLNKKYLIKSIFIVFLFLSKQIFCMQEYIEEKNCNFKYLPDDTVSQSFIQTLTQQSPLEQLRTIKSLAYTSKQFRSIIIKLLNSEPFLKKLNPIAMATVLNDKRRIREFMATEYKLTNKQLHKTQISYILGGPKIPWLCAATELENIYCVKRILHNKADPNIIDQYGRSPLFIAITIGNIALIELFKKYKALTTEIKIEDLHDAIRLNNLNAVKEILKHFEYYNESKQLNDTDKTGFSALHVAAYCGRHNLIPLLIHFDADLHKKSAFGDTALEIAKRNHEIWGEFNLETINILERKVLEENTAYKVMFSLSSPKENQKYLFEAAKTGNSYYLEDVLCLIEDINIQDQNGNTALHIAAANGHAKIVQILLLSLAKTNIENINRQTPIDIAINDEVFNLLTQEFQERETLGFKTNEI